ncbi:MAG: ribosome maturation factor RimP [Bdellovibrionales bacterium]
MTVADPILEKIRTLALPVIEREDCQLYELEFVGGSKGKGRTLRVYIDKSPNGASIEDCSNVSRALNEILDVDDVIPGGAYMLEVSTPGLDRILREKWHFDAVLGKRAHFRFNTLVENRKQVEATLVSVEGESVNVSFEEQNVEKKLKIPLESIHRARLVFEVPSNEKVKPGKGKKK